jgi:hypothetical protein
MTSNFEFKKMQDAGTFIAKTSKFGRDAVSLLTLFKKKADEI